LTDEWEEELADYSDKHSSDTSGIFHAPHILSASNGERNEVRCRNQNPSQPLDHSAVGDGSLPFALSLSPANTPGFVRAVDNVGIIPAWRNNQLMKSGDRRERDPMSTAARHASKSSKC
jgi:hypothetical protein